MYEGVAQGQRPLREVVADLAFAGVLRPEVVGVGLVRLRVPFEFALVHDQAAPAHREDGRRLDPVQNKEELDAVKQYLPAPEHGGPELWRNAVVVVCGRLRLRLHLAFFYYYRRRRAL